MELLYNTTKKQIKQPVTVVCRLHGIHTHSFDLSASVSDVMFRSLPFNLLRSNTSAAINSIFFPSVPAANVYVVSLSLFITEHETQRYPVEKKIP